MTTPTVMVIAGDPSGDQHASHVIAALLKANPEVRCTGIGGPAMCAAGFTPLMPFEPFNRMGYLEVILHLPFFLRASRYVKSYIRRTRPACVVCVDYSGFNIPVMKAAHACGIPVLWYIAPMVWAWKKKRAAVLARYAAEICCIFPFEVPCFKPFTENVHFVGNPVVESMPPVPEKSDLKMSPDVAPVVALVPGSRVQEVAKNLPAMLGAFRLLKARYPQVTALVSRYSGLPESLYQEVLQESGSDLFTGSLSELYRKADVAVVTSGTATLEAALAGLPHIIVYKTSPLTYAIFRHFVTISHIGLPNIIAQAGIVPECIQDQVDETVLCDKIELFLKDRALYRQTVERLMEIRTVLGSVRPSVAVSGLIRKYL
jgi:lipid-A-disaccharide synthase